MAQVANVPECWRRLLPCALHSRNIRYSFPVSGPPSCFLRETRTKQKEKKTKKKRHEVGDFARTPRTMDVSFSLLSFLILFFCVRVCVVTSNLCTVFKKRKKRRKETSDENKGYSKVLETSWTLAFSKHMQLIHFLFLFSRNCFFFCLHNVFCTREPEFSLFRVSQFRWDTCPVVLR